MFVVILCGCDVHAFANDSGGRQLRWLHSTAAATYYNLVSEPGTRYPKSISRDVKMWQRDELEAILLRVGENEREE